MQLRWINVMGRWYARRHTVGSLGTVCKVGKVDGARKCARFQYGCLLALCPWLAVMCL